MIAFEGALARAQADFGVVSAQEGGALAEELKTTVVTHNVLRQGVEASGVPVPALVAALRETLAHGEWLHWGATSQDVVDTALVLCLKDALATASARLSTLIDRLHRLSQDHASTILAGRTWTQIATPTTFGLWAARWAQPLIVLERELPDLGRHALRIQFGGAVGNNAVVYPHGAEISRAMADMLGLADGPPWHSDRTALYSLAAWFGRLTQALAKMAGDLSLLARAEIGEVSFASGGGSSTMPQKSNPVRAQTVGTLNTLVQADVSGLVSSGPHLEDRDGAPWLAERVLLPQIAIRTCAALRHGLWLAEAVKPNIGNMTKKLDQNPGAMAEAATFALARFMPRSEAQTLVKQALGSPESFIEALRAVSDAPVDWASVLDPGKVVPASTDTANRIFATRHG